MRDDGVELLERLVRLLERSHPDVNEPEVEDGLDTVRLHTDGLEKKLLRHVQLAAQQEAVALFLLVCLLRF